MPQRHKKLLRKENVVPVLCDPHLVARQAVLAPHQLEDDEAGARAGHLADGVGPEAAVQKGGDAAALGRGLGVALSPGLAVGAVVGAEHARTDAPDRGAADAAAGTTPAGACRLSGS